MVGFDAEGMGGGGIAVSCGTSGECVEGEDFDVWLRRRRGRPSRIVDESLVGTGDAVGGVHSGEEALAEPGLFAASGLAVPCGCRFERGPCLLPSSPSARQDASEVDAGERGHAHVARSPRPCRSPARGWPRRRGSRRLGTERSAEAGDLVGLGLQVAASPRRLGGPGDVGDRVVEPVLESGQLAEHGVAAHVQPRVVDLGEPAAGPARRRRPPALRRRRRSRRGRRRARWRPGPRVGRVGGRERRCGR